MRDYWLTQYILAAVGWGYAIVCTVAIALALWLPKGKTAKALSAAVVIGIASILPFRGYEQYRKEQEAAEAYKARLVKAQALFEERCKTAGEKIHKTVEGVEGIYLMKLRPSDINYGDQFKMDDPYGHDSTGKEYILNFLRGYYHQRNEPVVAGSPPRTGYAYVEAVDPNDGQRYRYTAGMKVVGQMDKDAPNAQLEPKRTRNYDISIRAFTLDKTPASGPAPRYGVTYDDISTHEEREYWIAGSSLKVVDLQTNEVIAERIGYMVDWAQGSRAGGRSPWLFAADNACPGFQLNPNFPVKNGSGEQAGQTLVFVEKVLKPSK